MRWIYKVVYVNAQKQSTAAILNQLGKDGWELASVVRGAQDYMLDNRELYLKKLKEE